MKKIKRENSTLENIKTVSLKKNKTLFLPFILKSLKRQVYPNTALCFFEGKKAVNSDPNKRAEEGDRATLRL